MSKYFYARVSSKSQSLARQIEAAKQIEGIDRIFSDKMSGKSFDRPSYQEMKSVLNSGDELVIKSLDRLGRNKEEMKSELAWFKANGIMVRVMDLPTTMIEMPVGQEWVMDMVNNILIEVLGAIAEQERLTIRERQREGIASMPIVDGKKMGKSGRVYGRPIANVDPNKLCEMIEHHRDGRKTVRQCCDELGICRATWYAMVKDGRIKTAV